MFSSSVICLSRSQCSSQSAVKYNDVQRHRAARLITHILSFVLFFPFFNYVKNKNKMPTFESEGRNPATPGRLAGAGAGAVEAMGVTCLLSVCVSVWALVVR